jgi:hypothetical protein
MALLLFGRKEMNAPQPPPRRDRSNVVLMPARPSQAPDTDKKSPPGHEHVEPDEPGYGHGV